MTETLTSLLTHNTSLSDDLDTGNLDNHDIVFNSHEIPISADKLFCNLKKSARPNISDVGSTPPRRPETHTATANTATPSMSNPEAFVKPSDYQPEPIDADQALTSSPAPVSLENPTPSISSPLGQRLKAEREKQGWPLDEVATQLKMTVSKLRDIEADDFAKISAPTYVIGYIRTYARWLNLPSEQVESLVTVYRQQHMQEVSLSEPLPSVKEPLESFRPPAWTASVLVSILLLGAVIGGFMFWQQQQAVDLPTFFDDKLSAFGDQATSEIAPKVEQTAEPKAVVITESNDVGAVFGAQATENDATVIKTLSADVPAEAQSSRLEQANSEPTVPESTSRELTTDALPVTLGEESLVSSSASTAVARDNAPITSEVDRALESKTLASNEISPLEEASVNASSEPTIATRQLLLEMVADSWMEVRDGEGNRKYTGVKKAGQQLVLNDLVPPISLHLGNARGVLVVVDGEDFPIQPRNGRDSLRVTIPAAKL